jgi:menaquinone-dependent protoporphyrinogen IX oxidase
MNKKVLVAYASKYGATKEIAEKIGQVLKEVGHASGLADGVVMLSLGGK